MKVRVDCQLRPGCPIAPGTLSTITEQTNRLFVTNGLIKASTDKRLRGCAFNQSFRKLSREYRTIGTLCTWCQKTLNWSRQCNGFKSSFYRKESRQCCCPEQSIFKFEHALVIRVLKSNWSWIDVLGLSLTISQKGLIISAFHIEGLDSFDVMVNMV